MFIRSIGKQPTEKDRKKYEEKTIYYKDGKFRNINEFSFDFKNRSEKSEDRVPKFKIPVVKQNSISDNEEGKLKFYWFAHSSVLIQLGKKNILIDPILTKYASPFSFVGVKRYSDIPIKAEDLPYIDLLLLSHDHYDHLDYQTLMAIKDRIGHIVVPLGVESFVKSWGFNEEMITSLNWWEETVITGITITATPSQHFSTRNPLHSNASWWCGFLISDDIHTVYFSGDGGYTDTFKEIGKKYRIDLALMECGQYDNGWPKHHMFPEECVQACIDVKAKWSLPVHWGAFCLCNSAWNDSVKRMVKKAEEMKINTATPLIGECVDYDEIDKYQNKWWM